MWEPGSLIGKAIASFKAPSFPLSSNLNFTTFHPAVWKEETPENASKLVTGMLVLCQFTTSTTGKENKVLSTRKRTPQPGCSLQCSDNTPVNVAHLGSCNVPGRRQRGGELKGGLLLSLSEYPISSVLRDCPSIHSFIQWPTASCVHHTRLHTANMAPVPMVLPVQGKERVKRSHLMEERGIRKEIVSNLFTASWRKVLPPKYMQRLENEF